MSEGALQKREYLFPERTSQAMTQLNEVEAQIKHLTSLKGKLRTFLTTSIEVEDTDPKHREGENDGVIRKDHMQQRVGHKPALEQVIEELLPNTKNERLREIMAENTKEIWVSKFSMLEDDEDFSEF